MSLRNKHKNHVAPIAVALFFLIFFSWTSLYAEKPLIGILGIENNSKRANAVALLLYKNLEKTVLTTGVFEAINSESLAKQLHKFGCNEEKCLVAFSKNAGIGVIVKGSVEDNGDHVIITLKSFGTETPYFGKIINTYKTEITIGKGYSAEEYNMICKEHSSYFLSSMLRTYKNPVSIGSLQKSKVYNGDYEIYRADTKDRSTLPFHKSIGTVTIEDKKISGSSISNNRIVNSDFILVPHRDAADFLESYIYDWKREIVLQETTINDFIYTVLFTIPVSAFMPIAAPYFGYFNNSDWAGLTLWGLNSGPYLYLEYSGFTNIPVKYRNDYRNIPKEVHTNFRFALYMAFAGGFSLFVDAVAHQYLHDAANYRGIRSLIGNTVTAAYCSLISGGGGHFYRGYRAWGYFYFHINNILMYMILREFSPTERYVLQYNRYFKSNINTDRGYLLIGIYGAVKLFETIHAIILDDQLRNGETTEETFTFEPYIVPELSYEDSRDETGYTIGLSLRWRF